MVNVHDVAAYILAKADRPLSTMQLQKLAYYCQAWHLAWTRDRLFAEDFQAWANGPVCRELYDAHRGRYSITAEDLTAGDPSKISPAQRFTMDGILDAYLPLSGLQLSALTHAEDPWIEARGALAPNARSETVITVDKMRKYYERLGNDTSAGKVSDLRQQD